MNEVNMTETVITKPTLVIVCFGPATPATGLRPAEYYQVTVDPDMCSPSGEYIRFGFYDNDEILGWQRVAGMTIVEVLGDSDKKLNAPSGYSAGGSEVKMMAVE